MKIILLLLVSIFCYTQKVHHQMISAQGDGATTQSGIVVKFTIGQ